MAWSVDIDGNDITSIVQSIAWRPKLSRPASCVVRFPAHLFSCGTGTSELHLSNGGLRFSGPVWFQEISGDTDAAYTEVTAYDHMVYFAKHLCKTPSDWPDNDWPEVNPPTEPGPCNLADPSKVITDFVSAPEIMAAFINATNGCDPGGMPISVGSVSTNGTSVEGVPSDWPMTLAAMAELLLGTGQLDIIVNPGYGASSVDLYPGNAGSNLTGSVVIGYQTGSFNATGAHLTSDMEDVVNALWYLLGPKVPQYDFDISHWAGSITPTAANAGGDGEGGIPGTPWPADLVARFTGSRGTYGYMQEIQVHDTREDEDGIRPLYEEMWANEAWIRAVPKTIAGAHPDRTTSAPPFGVGDIITLAGGSRFGGGFSGGFRVYEYEVQVDADGVGDITEIIGSTNGD